MRAARIALVLMLLTHACVGAPVGDPESWLTAHRGDADESRQFSHVLHHSAHTAFGTDMFENEDDSYAFSDMPDVKRRRLTDASGTITDAVLAHSMP